jgi:hypothetical protein
MSIPTHINTIFTDSNNDNINVKISTKPFINGSIDDIIDWMVRYQFANIDMEDTKTGETPFFLACRYNTNDNLIKWLIQTDETTLTFENKYKMNVINYLKKHNCDCNRINLLLELWNREC